jgi:hypothetical protein
MQGFVFRCLSELFLFFLSQVQTDDQAGTQGRDKDPRSLSGGEKSFATICLLLSLWESIGCPIRCLGTRFLLFFPLMTANDFFRRVRRIHGCGQPTN